MLTANTVFLFPCLKHMLFGRIQQTAYVLKNFFRKMFVQKLSKLFNIPFYNFEDAVLGRL